MRLALLGTFAIVLLAMSCAYCASRPPTYPHLNPHIGGPRFRVFDVDEIDSIDEIPALRSLFRLAEECAGVTGNFAPIRVFAVSKIEVKRDDTGKWTSNGVTGVWARNTPWIYVTTGRTPEQTARTIVHEYVHYLTKKSHPESDLQNRACNDYLQTTGDE